MPHQIIAVEKLILTRIGAAFMEMGTGKSRTAIELVYRRLQKIDKVIWFCPVSLKQTVKQEILKHTDDTSICVFNNKISEANIPKYNWYVIGIESMSSSNRVVATTNKLITKKTFIILDESSYIKGHDSTRTQRITKLSEKALYRLILTGTPISQGVVDLYAQMRFLSPKILGYNSFYSFAANHLEYSEKYPNMILRSHNIGFIAAKIKPYVYQVTKNECMHLPDKLYETRYFGMTDQQSYYYDEVKKELLEKLDKYDEYDVVPCFTSSLIFKTFIALQQIVCGFLNKNRQLFKEFQHYRIDTLRNIILEIPKNCKVIIFCKYQHDITDILKILGDDAAVFHGALSEKIRNEQVELFRTSKRFFLATQQSGGHGLTLNEAHYVIFYNNVFKYAERVQSEDRCHRIGQKSKVTYIDICCDRGIDLRIEKALSNKSNIVQDFKNEIEKVKNIKELIKAL